MKRLKIPNRLSEKRQTMVNIGQWSTRGNGQHYTQNSKLSNMSPKNKGELKCTFPLPLGHPSCYTC